MAASGLAPSIERRLAEAADAQRRGDGAAARRLYESVLAGAPEQPVALNALGMIALQERDYAAARALFARAAAADRGAAPLWMNLATANRHLGNDEGERASLAAALAIDRRHLMANIRMAELHTRLGEVAQANQAWAAVLALCWAMPARPPELEAVMERAKAYVGDRNREFAATLDAGLAELRAGIEPQARRRFETCMDAVLGRRRIYVNECHGMHFPFLPADEFFEPTHFPWLAEAEAAAPAVRAELEALLTPDLAGFEPYVAMEPGTPDNKWSALDRSPDWSALYLWRYGERQDAVCARCPQTAALLERLPLADIPYRGPTAFFSVLRPRTRLPAHTGVSNLRAIVHLPLIVPQGCGFRVGGETREWREGEAFAFDDTIEHEAWNDSDRLRAVLIFDTWNPHLTAAERDLMRAFFATAHASGLDPGVAAAVAD